MISDIRLLGFLMNKDTYTRVCKKSEFYNQLNDLIKTNCSDPLSIVEKISTPTSRVITAELKNTVNSFLREYEI